MNELPRLLLGFVPLLFSLSVHEAAHAWMANRKGDPTARLMGRMTVNPIVHIDIFGTIVFPILAFLLHFPIIGWAKPVPVNERNLRNWRWDGILVAAAGPVSNLILAVGFTAALFILVRISTPDFVQPASFAVTQPLIIMANYGIYINLVLALFNFLPMPPLDGGRVAGGLFPQWSRQLAILERYGFIILLLLLYTKLLHFIVFMPAHKLYGLLLGIAT